MSYTLDFPIQYIPNPDRFATIGLGELYIGVVDGDPAFEPADRVQAYIARQNDTDLAIPQPIELSAGGVPVYLGSQVTLKINQSFSAAVLDKNGQQVYYSPKSGEIIDEINDLESAIDDIANSTALIIENVAALAIFAPSVDRIYLLKEYYLGAGTGGGQLLAKSGVITPNNVTTFVSATAGIYFERINSEIDFYKAGGHPSRTAAQNLAALKAMIAATPEGGIATVHSGGDLPYIIDCTGGLSAAADITKKMTLVVDGVLKSNFGALQANPPFILKVSGQNVTITGAGMLQGDGTVNDLNTGDETTFPGLLYVTGNNFNCSIKTIDTPPKVGIALYGCNDAVISVERWLGGVVTYTVGNAAYFGVRILGGRGHTICGNDLSSSSSTGRLVNAIFSIGCNNLKIYNNKSRPFEKIVYLYTNHSMVYDNEIVDALITDAIRINGSYNKVYDNKGDKVKGGIVVYDGAYNKVHDNYFTGVTQVGIYCGKLSPSYSGNLSGNEFLRNKLYADLTSTTLSSGIDVNSNTVGSTDIKIDDNTVEGFGKLFDEANIILRAPVGFNIVSSTVNDNFVSGGLRAGITVDRVANTSVSRNKGRAITEYMIAELNSGNNTIINNEVKTVGSIGINGLSSSTFCSGNKYTDRSLTGSVSLSAAITTTVVHGGIAPNARVFIQPANTIAGLLSTTKGAPYTGVSGVDFTISMANGTAAGGGETFFYKVEQ